MTTQTQWVRSFAAFYRICLGVVFLVLASKQLNIKQDEQRRQPHLEQLEISTAAAHRPSALNVQPFRRLGNIPVAEFEKKYSSPGHALPTIFSKELTADTFVAQQWTRESLRDVCGNYPLLQPRKNDCRETGVMEEQRTCHDVKYSNKRYVGSTWGGMVPADLRDIAASTVGELLDAQDKGYAEYGQQIALFDAPLQHHCPDLMDAIRVPKYFGRDYLLLQQTVRDEGLAVPTGTRWPSIIVSKQGGGSFLHADAHTSRFWAQQLSGRKRWRVFDVADSWKLVHRNVPYHFYPTIFDVDAFDPDFEQFPNLNGSTVYEAVTEPGETVFIPEGWPHQVINLEDSVLTSVNFFDEHALQTATASKKNFDKQCPILFAAFFMPLDPFTMPTEDNIRFHDFFDRNRSLKYEPVPQTVIEWVKEGGKTAIDGEWDAVGLPALHVAVYFEFASVVQYLLTVGGGDVNAPSRVGKTALDCAELHGRWDMRDMLLQYGATGRLHSPPAAVAAAAATVLQIPALNSPNITTRKADACKDQLIVEVE